MLKTLKNSRLDACAFIDVPAESAGSHVILCRAEA